jgi:hypothetical protein
METKTLWWAVKGVAVVVLGIAVSALAWPRTPSRLAGVINDYTPIAGTTTAYEVRGPWSLNLNADSGTAEFSAALTMELSVLGQSSANVQGAVLLQHTHHITMKDATVTYNPSDCPPHAANTPPYVSRIEVKGSATVAANGGPFPPPPATPEPSELKVCIDGGTDVAYSNITLSFGTPASGHFGSQAIHGVVRDASFDEH